MKQIMYSNSWSLFGVQNLLIQKRQARPHPPHHIHTGTHTQATRNPKRAEETFQKIYHADCISIHYVGSNLWGRK